MKNRCDSISDQAQNDGEMGEGDKEIELTQEMECSSTFLLLLVVLDGARSMLSKCHALSII